MSVNFRPGDRARRRPSAVLSIELPDKSYRFTYPMHEPEQAEMRGVLSSIRQRYAQQTALTDRLEQTEDPGRPRSEENKDYVITLSNQVSDLLRYQEILEVTTLFHASAEQDEQQAKKQNLLMAELNDWYIDGIGAIRDQLRNMRDGLSFVRELLRSPSELLVDLGIRLAREPSIRPAIQKELVDIFRNEALPVQTRRRAFSYLRAEVRGRAVRGH